MTVPQSAPVHPRRLGHPGAGGDRAGNTRCVHRPACDHGTRGDPGLFPGRPGKGRGPRHGDPPVGLSGGPDRSHGHACRGAAPPAILKRLPPDARLLRFQGGREADRLALALEWTTVARLLSDQPWIEEPCPRGAALEDHGTCHPALAPGHPSSAAGAADPPVISEFLAASGGPFHPGRSDCR